MKLALFLLSATLVFASCSSDKNVVEPMQVLEAENQKINVYDIDGLPQYLSTKDDNVHVVNFWATWCGPCVKELPYFENVNKEEGVEVTLVSIDAEEDFEKKLVPFVNKRDLKSNVIVVNAENESAFMETVDPNWASSIPATLIFNKHKSIFIDRPMSQDELEREIEKFKL